MSLAASRRVLLSTTVPFFGCGGVGFLVFLLVAIAASCIIAHFWVNRPDRSTELPPLIMAGSAVDDVPAYRRPRQSTSESEPVRAQSGRPAALSIIRSGASPDESDTAQPLHFRQPADATVQLLPGRLEVLAGEPRQHQEIRFIRVPGAPAELILGREPGVSPQHIAFESSTVSRRHARLAFADGRWALSNLSQTNPVVVNDQELTVRDGRRLLVDGDRLELGEVSLRFHAH